jgi:hypothetical protein
MDKVIEIKMNLEKESIKEIDSVNNSDEENEKTKFIPPLPRYLFFV